MARLNSYIAICLLNLSKENKSYFNSTLVDEFTDRARPSSYVPKAIFETLRI